MSAYYAGIDLAWKERGQSGLCIMDENGKIIETSLMYDDDIALTQRIKSYETLAFVAIDAPIEITNLEGSRKAEREMMKRPIKGHYLKAFQVSRSYMQRHYGLIRGEVISNSFSAEMEPVFLEVYPTGNVLGLIGEKVDYKVKAGRSLEALITAYNRLLMYLYRFEDEGVVQGIRAFFPLVMTEEIKTKKNYKALEDLLDGFLSVLIVRLIDINYGEHLIFGDEGLGQIHYIVIEEQNVER